MRQIVINERTGPRVVRPAELSLMGDSTGDGSTHRLDFGTIGVGLSPATLSFRVKNGGRGYAHTLVGAVELAGLDDARLTIQLADIGFLVGNARSERFRLTLDPSSVGLVFSETLIFRGRQLADNAPALNSPLRLEVHGFVVGDEVFVDGFESGDTSAWRALEP